MPHGEALQSVTPPRKTSTVASVVAFDGDQEPSRVPNRGVADLRTDTILLFDQSAERLRSLADALSDVGHCCRAHSLAEVREFLANNRVRMVVADASACSSEFLQAVGAHEPSAECVFVADSNEVSELVKAYAAQHVFRVTVRDQPPSALRAFVESILHPRLAHRHALADIVAEFVVNRGEVIRCPVVDVSNRGFSAHVEPAQGILLPGTAVTGVVLRRGALTLLSDVGATARYIETVSPETPSRVLYKLGLEFKKPAGRHRDDVATVLTEPVRILATLQEGLRRGPVTVHVAEVGIAVSVGTSARLDSAERELAVDAPPLSGIEVGDVVSTRFEFAGASYSFVSSINKIHVGAAMGYSMRIPRALRVIRQRNSARFRPRTDKPVILTPTSPFNGLLTPRPAANITASGAAFRIDGARELVPIGTRLERLRMRLPDGMELECSGIVRTLVASGTRGCFEFTCGVEFQDLATVDRARLADALVQTERPTLRDGTGVSFDALWAFFLETRFLYPEKLERMQPDAVRETLTRLLAQANDVFKAALVVENGRIEGHASCLRAYRRTWILQHLAALATGKVAMTRGRMLNLAVIEYLEQLPGIEWVKIWYRPTNRWPARVFGGFARKLGSSEWSHLRTYRYMVGPPGQLPFQAKTVSVRTAEPGDYTLVEAYFIGRRFGSLIRADDLTSNDFALSEVNSAYGALGLERRREALVAERNGVFAGFALLEISSTGLNFSELTNTFQVFPSDPEDMEVRQALISAADSRYRQLGYVRSIGLAAERADAFEKVGFTGVKEYSCWTWHRSKYQAFCEHVLRLGRWT